MDAADRFREVVGAPGSDVRLDEAALCIAACGQPGVDVDAGCARLDELAAACSAPSFDAVREELFARRGFSGATDDYADPRNSYLDAVLERRRGIPISLSVVVIEVARRLGVAVNGIGMPGHFLVQEAGADDIWCDPFYGGELLDVDGCRARFDALFHGARVLRPSDLTPTPAARHPRPHAGEPRARPARTRPPRAGVVVRAAPRNPGRARRGSRAARAQPHARARGLELSMTAMFPLGSVLFPYALLPLHVFEPRYRVMMRHCLQGDKEFGVVLIERGSEVGGGDVRFDVGTRARIVQANELPDGRWAVQCVGMQRLRVARWLDDDPFPRADTEDLPEPQPGAGAHAAAERVRAGLQDVLALWHQLDERVPTEVPEVSNDPTRGLFELAALAPIGPLDAQAVLAAPDAPARGELLAELLADRAEELRARLR